MRADAPADAVPELEAAENKSCWSQAAQAQNVRTFFFHFYANVQCSVTYGIRYITTNSTTQKRDVSIWRCCITTV